MKHLIYILLLFLIITNLSAKTDYMKVNLNNGTSLRFPIEDILKITFNGDITKIKNLEKVSQLVKAFTLLQNYPNPFNPTTSIQYEIPKSGSVKILIFNIKGQKVLELNKLHQEAGSYKFIWDGKGENGLLAASGLYLYTIIFENSTISKKMTLVK